MPYLNVAFNLPLGSTYSYYSDLPVSPGCRIETELGRRKKMTGWVISCSTDPPEGIKQIKSIDKIVDKKSLFSVDTLPLAQWMSKLTMCSLGEALSCMIPGGRREKWKLALSDEDDALHGIMELSEDQQNALDVIFADLSGRFYLYGETGSGKTEVFLRTAERILSVGKAVIYLVPEIALSHHLIEGISRRFSNNIAVLHSGLTPSERLREWRKVQDGSARFVLGVRSAVFAPVENLGLVIIDEEHESSYKSSSTPRYHARQIAMHRCRDSKALLIMGSATPSVEAWALMERGGVKALRLNGRPGGGATPDIKVIDMNREKDILARDTARALARVLGSGRQALLFLNRRGFSYNYSCLNCGQDVLCRNCTVPLTYHKSRKAMLCHYCGYRQPPPSQCPHCSSMQMRIAGFGTERIEEDVQKLFPEKRIVRLDSDSARRKGVLENTLKDFRKGSIDVLLGTQMVAKGLNAPGLKLAVILSADTALNMPDFRATERGFSLIVQVAGRVGRFAPDGEVLIQTYRPQAYPIRYAAEGKIGDFYSHEIQQRRLLGFPPFSRLFRIVARGKKQSDVDKILQGLAAVLQAPQGECKILGPAECPLAMIEGAYRKHLILVSLKFDRTHAALRDAIAVLPRVNGLRVEVDIDPLNLL